MAKLATAAPVGWPLLPLPDSAGRLEYPGLEESVRQSIEVILSTRPGEQLMRPFFGAGLQDSLHEPNTITTRKRIRDLIAESIERWEPRITVNRIEVAEAPSRPSMVHIEIAYQLKRTGAAQRIGLMMELES